MEKWQGLQKVQKREDSNNDESLGRSRRLMRVRMPDEMIDTKYGVVQNFVLENEGKGRMSADGLSINYSIVNGFRGSGACNTIVVDNFVSSISINGSCKQARAIADALLNLSQRFGDAPIISRDEWLRKAISGSDSD